MLCVARRRRIWAGRNQCELDTNYLMYTIPKPLMEAQLEYTEEGKISLAILWPKYYSRTVDNVECISMVYFEQWSIQPNACGYYLRDIDEPRAVITQLFKFCLCKARPLPFSCCPLLILPNVIQPNGPKGNDTERTHGEGNGMAFDVTRTLGCRIKLSTG